MFIFLLRFIWMFLVFYLLVGDLYVGKSKEPLSFFLYLQKITVAIIITNNRMMETTIAAIAPGPNLASEIKTIFVF